MGGRLAKQAPRTSSRPRQDSVSNNLNRDETSPLQTRSPAYDATHRKPSNGKCVIEVPADRNERDVLKLKTAKTTVNIGTWNVRSLLGSGKSDLLVKEMQRLQWDVVGLAELRWKDQGVLEQDEGCKIIFSGASKQGLSGVGFLLSDTAFRSVISVDPFSDRIMSIRCRGQGPNITIFQVYAPTTSHSDDVVEDFYATLQSKIDAVPKQDILIIMGDWNAKVGKDHETWGPTIGKHGYGEMNSRGEHLLYFCKENSLTITNTLFKHKPSRKWTWISPDHKSKNMIDLILIRDRWRSAVDNTRSFQSVDIGSDHSLVLAKIRVKFKVEKKGQRKKKWNLTKLDDPSTEMEFQLELKNRFQLLVDETDISVSNADSLLEQTTTAIKETADNILGAPRPKKKPWISDATLALTDERRKARKKAIQDPSHRQEYNRLTRAIQRGLKADKEKWYSEKCQTLEINMQQHKSKEVFNTIKTITKGIDRNPTSNSIRSSSGELLSDPKEVERRWFEYGKALYNHQPTIDASCVHSPTVRPSSEPSILRSEVEAAVHKLKNGKAPGTDEIPGELLKHGGDCMIDQLHQICNGIWMDECIPDEWTKSIILTMPKKGDITKCENYRTISLINHSSKILLEIIRRRMKPYVESILAEEQAGFRPGRSTVEQVFALKLLIQHRIEKKDGKVFAVFIDYKKAFDRVWHDGLFSVLQHYGVPQKLINIIRDLYNKAKSCIRLNNNFTEWFETTIGVRQGCLLSPDLFNLFLENILAEAFEDCKNLGINVDGCRLKDLRFADDIALIADSEDDLQTLIQQVHAVSKKYGMEISIPKTKAMIFSRDDQLQVNIKLDGTSLEQVNRFKYLGVTLTPSNDSTSEIQSRLMLASTALGKLQKVWTDKDISLTTKLRLVNALVYPVLLYGSEIWTIKANDLKKLVAFEMRCFRKILNISWKDKIRNEEVLSRISSCAFKSKRILARITESQLTWFGHVCRMNNIRHPKRILLETVPGTNRQGRPRKRWEDDILATCSTFHLAYRNAQDRNTWAEFVRGANVLWDTVYR